MSSKKLLGSYYTPEVLSSFIFNHLFTNLELGDELMILEPSLGDGSFLKALLNNTLSLKFQLKFTGVEIVDEEIKKAKHIVRKHKNLKQIFKFYNQDFLEFNSPSPEGYQIIIGNPPYIKKSLLDRRQIDLCNDIHYSAGLELNTINIWTAFLIKCSGLLTIDGALGLVLPAEILQLKYAKKLQEFLKSKFIRIEIFTFENLMFECKGQDTVLLFAFKKHRGSGIFFTHIPSTEHLSSSDFQLKENLALEITQTKWTHHSILPDDLLFLNQIFNRFSKVHEYCDSKPGIVTAANDFFIVNKKVAEEYELLEYTQPIIQKGYYVQKNFSFTVNEFENLEAESKPARLVALQESDLPKLSSKAKIYFEMGIAQGINNGYKCRKRKIWSIIPNISTIPQAFFLRRIYRFPKLVKNEANVYVTDTAYKIEVSKNYHLDSLLYSFYNSVTLLSVELCGRIYGGGVLEITPSEFKSLPIPYIPYGSKAFKQLEKLFKSNMKIQQIIFKVDEIILKSFYGLHVTEIERIQLIYKTLISNRLKD